ncbi:MAG: hypothetical protein CMF99_05900 [Candidatus Marinimicrobia bacterium]|nr:hypothetical protein [Candidatus Neomarinimicrobiota bacterium]|tara:strand:+ start:12774 stop:14051 length:1278 start_codon:yes stop_codon:yes gene_type:complete
MSYLNKIKKLNTQKKIGILFIISLIFINQYVWLEFFDSDGYMKPVAKSRILFVDFLLLFIGLFLYFSNFDYKVFFKKLVYVLYLFIAIEILSYLALRVLFPFYFGQKNTDWVSRYIPDLRSDYKPNEKHPSVNKQGFRYGGNQKKSNAFRIMCIGGSTTWSTGVLDSDPCYPQALEMYLISKGYNVEVINAGVPYHTSLDALMRLITKGVYYNPDLLLIHTGINDIGPLTSPEKYKADYSHWRKVGFSNNKFFKKLWDDFPSSFFRLFLLMYLNPSHDYSLSIQTSEIKHEMLSRTLVNQDRLIGFKKYFSGIINIAKANNIKPITILANNDQRRDGSFAKQFSKKENIEYAINRNNNTQYLLNTVMDSISAFEGVAVIPFNEFKPSKPSHWKDSCHLNSEGTKEKANFIGDYLIKKIKLPSIKK